MEHEVRLDSQRKIERLEAELSTQRVAAQAQEKMVVEGYQKIENMLRELESKRSLLEEKNAAAVKATDFINRVTNSMDEILLVLGPDGKLIRVNKRVTDLLGYAPEELVGKYADVLFDKDALEEFKKGTSGYVGTVTSIVYQNFMSQRHLKCEAKVLSKNGDQIIHLFNSSILFNPQGKKEGIVIIGTDIRDIKKALDSLQLARADIQNMLDNLDQGFMVCDRDGTVLEGHSRAASTFFEVDLIGKKLWDIVHIPEARNSEVQEWLSLLFLETVPFDDVKGFGPASFENKQSRFIELDYRPIRDADGLIDRLIVISTDRTVEKELQKKALKEAKVVKMIMAIVQNRSDFTAFFVPEARRILAEVKQELTSAPDVHSLFRKIHTIKGTSASYHIDTVESLSQEIEERLSALRKATGDDFGQAIAKLCADVDVLEKAFEDFLIDYRGVVGNLTGEGGREKSLFLNDILEIGLLLQKSLGDNSELVKKYTEYFLLEPAHLMLQKYRMTVQNVAEKLQKEVDLVIEESAVKVFREKYGPLVNSMVHIFRNAVDHGIESPEDREAAGKSSTGKITVQFAVDKSNPVSNLKIVIADDGRGIDPEKIANLAVKREVITLEQNQKLTDQQRIQLVFAPGFSTKDEVTDISGRGVGLDSVNSEAQALGGCAWVESIVGQGSTFHLSVPLFSH